MKTQPSLLPGSDTLSRLVSLLQSAGVSKAHSEAVTVDNGDGCTYGSWRLTPAAKAEFEQLRQGVDDRDIVRAMRRR